MTKRNSKFNQGMNLGCTDWHCNSTCWWACASLDLRTNET